jgi:hypothetical protein
MSEPKYKYIIERVPIDNFLGCVQEKDKGWCCPDEKIDEENRNEYEESAKFARDILPDLCGEDGKDISELVFFAIPIPEYCTMDLCMLVKIGNNGTTYIFTNDPDFSRFVSGTRDVEDFKDVYWRGQELCFIRY